MSTIRKIISGGQSGADRAAWDAAIQSGVPCGGWVPRWRLAEDGAIPSRYTNLRETATAHVEERTRRNVGEADATLILFRRHLQGGSLKTREFARELGRPCLALDVERCEGHEQAVAEIRRWLMAISGGVVCLNVAGPRASEDPEIYDVTRKIISLLFKAL